MKSRKFFILSALVLGCLLSGCGLKGPLYMPHDDGVAATQETAQTGDGADPAAPDETL